MGWEGGSSSSLEREQRIDTLCSQTQPVPGSSAAEPHSQRSHLGQCLGWDHIPGAPGTASDMEGLECVHQSRSVLGQALGHPSPPRESPDEPLEARPRAALFGRAQAPGMDAKGKPGVLGFGTAPEWVKLLISAFPPRSPPHPSSQPCWTPSIPAAMAGTLWS